MSSEAPTFFYTEFTARNQGFVTEAQQEKLRTSRVFVCGVGGRGGAAVQSLARLGVENFILADTNVVQVSNLNRHVFATMDGIGVEKTDATARGIHAVNPHADVKSYGSSWPQRLSGILQECDVIINGMDDVGETIKLHRACQAEGKTIVDAYAATLPNVYVTRAQDNPIEARLNYPTLGKEPAEWEASDLSDALLCELEFVIAASSSQNYIEPKAFAEIAKGKRSPTPFAPMVILTGNLMAYEVFKTLLGKASGANAQGYFFNPYTGETERPGRGPSAWRKRRAARKFLAGLTGR